LLFRKRTKSSQNFVRVLLERIYFKKEETSLDILSSYAVGLGLTKCISTPFEVCGTASQIFGTSNISLLASLKDKNRGRILWAGLSTDFKTTILNVVIENLVFDVLKNRLAKGKDGPQMLKSRRLKASIVAKFIAVLCTYAGEVLRTRKISSQFQPTQFPLTLRACTKDIFMKPRILKFGSGLGPSLVKAILYTFLKELLFRKLQQLEEVSNRHNESRAAGFSKALMLDYISEFVTESILYPMTVIIRKLQMDPNRSFFETLTKVWKRERFQGLFQGFQYYIMDTIFIYFGAMLFFTFCRTLIRNGKKLLKQTPKTNSE